MKFLSVLIFTFLSIANLYAKENCMNFGIVPYAEVSDIKNDYKGFKEWVEKQTGRCLNIYTTKDYSELIMMFGQGSVDCARVGPFSYALIDKEVSVEPIVVGVKNDGSFCI